MELLDYIKLLTPAALEAFARQVGTTVAHLRNVAYKQRVASAALAAQIQLHTREQVTVAILRPKDWHLIWGAGLNQAVKAGIVADHLPDGTSLEAQSGSRSTGAGQLDDEQGGEAVHGATVGSPAAGRVASQTAEELV